MASEVLDSSGLEEIRHSLEVAESLARASLLTPISAKNRLLARSLEFEGMGGAYVPPKEVLLYLVR